MSTDNSMATLSKSQLKILLLQIRDDELTMQEEIEEFARFSGLRREQFSVLNAFMTKDFDADMVNDYHALFIGGSSDASVLRPDEFTFLADCKLMLRYCYHANIPVFASCFGFQLLVQEFGGEVILDAQNMEMGTYAIELTDTAKDDLLFHDMPNPFWAVSGHKERALTLPANAVSLAYTTHCPYHAIKIHHKPIYGFQFHPEIDTPDLLKRITRYQDLYLENAAELEMIKQNAHPDTTHANALVERFIERVILKKP